MIVDTIYIGENNIPGLMSRKSGRLKLPRGERLSLFYSEVDDALIDLKNKFFSGYLDIENYIKGEKGKILIIDGKILGAHLTRPNGELAGAEALKELLNFRNPDIYVYEFDPLDVQLALELNRSKLEYLDEEFEKILSQPKKIEPKFIPISEIEKEEDISREELLKKYRIRVPDDDEIEKLLRENGF